jgi:branched-chain amino acid transport system ATP-binding protein
VSDALLSISDLTVRYSGVVAVDHVSLDIERGSFVGLIGPNGAGKTTLIDAVCGFAEYTGAVSFNGRPLDGLSAFQRSRLGLARTFQAGELFDDLTVIDNVMVGSYLGSMKGVIREVLRGRPTVPSRQVMEVLEMFELTREMKREVQDLPVGSRKLVAVARALAGSPQLILLDEPAAGLDSTESRHLGETLRRLPETGVTVMLVDHDIDLVLEVCELVHALDIGRVIASGDGAEIRTHPQVMESYLGTSSVRRSK